MLIDAVQFISYPMYVDSIYAAGLYPNGDVLLQYISVGNGIEL